MAMNCGVGCRGSLDLAWLWLWHRPAAAAAPAPIRPLAWERPYAAGAALKTKQNKPTMRYHLTLVRMAIINKITNNKCWRGCGERESSYTVGGNVNWYSHYGKQCGDSLENSI